LNATRSSLLLAALALATVAVSATELPGRHPAYLHALTDLRDARWNLEHRPGDAAVSSQEDVAITEIDRAIAEARKAAAEDGKNVADHPHEDANLDHAGRLHRAQDLLRKAHDDVHAEEDNPETRELRRRVDEHIDLALRATDRSIRDVEQHR
jgi:hypothetical protein